MASPVYTDLNILKQSNLKLLEIFELSIELGFELCGINYVATSLQGGKGKKNDKVTIPNPKEILLNDETIKELQRKCQSFKQLSRLTAVLEDASNTHRLGVPDIQAFDIIAVQPTNEKTFQHACSTLDVDIISLNFSENLGFSLKRPMVKLAVKRGIHFEIVYSPALKNNTVKRNIISNALSLVRAGGGKNIVLSSGSCQALDMRSPYDVINLARLFGLSHSQAKDSISRNCRAVLKHAESRKTCKSVISVMRASSLPNKDQWILCQNNIDQRITGANSDADVDGEEDGDEDTDDDDDDDDEENGVNKNDYRALTAAELESKTESSDLCSQPDRKKIKI